MKNTRLLLALLACIAATVLMQRSFAPQIPTLLREGFPAPVWPGTGQHVLVAGSPLPFNGPSATLPRAAAVSFDATGGRALIAAEYSGGAVTTIFEQYGENIDHSTQLNSYSMVKTLTAALVLKAIAEGRIDSLETPLPDILGPSAPDVQLREVMTMTSGLSLRGEPPKEDLQKPLNDARFSPFSPVGKLHALGIETLLPDLRINPGMRGGFNYQSANTALLGLVVETAFGQPIQTVLAQKIWGPSGAAAALWRTNPRTGRASVYCCLYATARDWVRVGVFLSRNGDGETDFLPPDLWSDWIMPVLSPEQRQVGYYGLHIRHDILDRPNAVLHANFTYLLGHGGQILYLLPQKNRVVVRFGEAPQLLHSTLYDLFPDG